MATRDRIQEEEPSKMEEGGLIIKCDTDFLSSKAFVNLLQKVVAELVGTYFVIFAGCGSVAVNKIYGNVTFPGICVTWGLIVMVMIYTVGHVSGAHFNPAVTIAFSIYGRFSWKEVPWYIAAQLLGSTLASGTLSLMFDVAPEDYFGTLPVGSDRQSLVIEIVISCLLMFVVSAVGTDSRANANLGGLVIGMTITLNVFVAG
ncbi:OLC1v1010646C2 [Oldenlandia corymbosa var. corymbosa]|nr:OLC1v1010646C2 [Oldenlandia corymbosa var. corymbosa]